MHPQCMDTIQCSSVAQLCQLFVTPWTAARQASLSITNSQSLPKPMSIELVMPSNHLILSSPSPPVLNLFQHQGLFKWVSSSHQVAKVLGFQLQISPTNEHTGLISFRMEWLDLLAGQGTLKSLFYNTILQKHQFFSTQLSSRPNSHNHTWPLGKP